MNSLPLTLIATLILTRQSIMLVQGVQSTLTEKEHYAAAEATWVDGNRNILGKYRLSAHGHCLIAHGEEVLAVLPAM